MLNSSLLINLSGCLAGDPVDVVRQQDQHHPPGRLRRPDQVGGAGTRHLLAFLPSKAFTTFLVEFSNKFNEKWNISCFFIELARMRSNERASNLTLLFANHAQLSVPPTRLLFHSSGCQTAENFSGFSAPEFCCNSHF